MNCTGCGIKMADSEFASRTMAHGATRIDATGRTYPVGDCMVWLCRPCLQRQAAAQNVSLG